MNRAEALAGCVLGTAAGDAIGLPFENLSRADVARLAPRPLEHSLVFGRGLVSDDTEHTAMVLLSLIDANGQVGAFERRLAARLRWWLLALPPATGSATARAILKSWLGFPPARSGVHSAGNGPAMRAGVIGVAFADDPRSMRAFVQASTRLTHTDPRAFDAALAVAVAAACASRSAAAAPAQAFDDFVVRYRETAGDTPAFDAEIERLSEAVREGATLPEFARRLGCADGVSGFALHTVPLTLYAWLRHGNDFREAITQVVACGGDTDSTAAIAGAIIGAGLGPDGIPPSWLARLLEWPRGARWMQARCDELAAPSPPRRSLVLERTWLPWQLARNLGMLALVLVVASRRCTLLLLRRAAA